LSLNQYFWTNAGKPIHKSAHYLPIYERHFAPFVGRSIFMLEIGTWKGGSAQMWKHYFGPAARIVTCDINPECKAHEDEQVMVRIGDQSDPKFLAALLAEFGTPDIVLDDGSHEMRHVNASFEYLYPRLARDGVYFVEDLHTAYWDNYGGGLRAPGSFIETAKGLVDFLNADYVRDGALPPTEFSRTARSMHFYDSVVVIEKGPFQNKKNVIVGDTGA
jgi:cephalosporin hydroxylase